MPDTIDAFLYSPTPIWNTEFGWDFVIRACRACGGDIPQDDRMPDGWTRRGHQGDCPVPVVAARIEVLKDALTLIAGDRCASFMHGRCWEHGRTRGAEYAGEAWCDQCIAAAALTSEAHRG